MVLESPALYVRSAGLKLLMAHVRALTGHVYKHSIYSPVEKKKKEKVHPLSVLRLSFSFETYISTCNSRYSTWSLYV